MGWRDAPEIATPPGEAAASWRSAPLADAPSKSNPVLEAGETAADALTGAASTGGILDPLIAAAGAAGSYAVPYTEGHFFDPSAESAGYGATFKERWAQEMKNLRGRKEEAQRRSPNASMVGSVAPVLLAPEALATLPTMSETASALPLATRMAAGAGDAALYAGASAAASNLDKNPADAAGAAMTNPATLAAGAAAPLAAAIPGGLARTKAAMAAALPKVKVSPAAAELQRQGVEGLTVGQMAPESKLGQVEEIGTHATLVGPGLKAKRAAAEQSFREAAINKALPPGAEAPTGSTQERLASVYDAFDPAYAKIKSEAVYPAVHGKGLPLQSSKRGAGAFDLAASDPGVTADDATRAVAKRFLDNQLSILPGGAQHPGMLQRVEAGDLLKMRSNIRGAIRQARASQKYDLADLLGNAEQAVSDTVASQLSPESTKHLAATDRQYAKFATIEDAAARGGVDSEFTPKHLGAALKKSMGKRATTQGRAGELQDLAQAGDEVFGVRTPLTGMRAIAELPGGKLTTGLAAYGMNTPTGRALLLPGQSLAAPLPLSPRMAELARALAMVRALRGDL